MGQQTRLALKSFWPTVKAVTLIFVSWRGSAISSAQERKNRFYLFGKEFKIV